MSLCFQMMQGKTHVLVATDVAARGLDVNNVDLVVHWDVPGDSETYLHRSGRTGRAGNKGTAIVLIGQHDKGRVGDIMRCVSMHAAFRVTRTVLLLVALVWCACSCALP